MFLFALPATQIRDVPYKIIFSFDLYYHNRFDYATVF